MSGQGPSWGQGDVGQGHTKGQDPVDKDLNQKKRLQRPNAMTQLDEADSPEIVSWKIDRCLQMSSHTSVSLFFPVGGPMSGRRIGVPRNIPIGAELSCLQMSQPAKMYGEGRINRLDCLSISSSWHVEDS